MVYFVPFPTGTPLLPFMNYAASVELDYLNNFLKESVAAFPKMLKIGYFLEKMDPTVLYSIRDDINSASILYFVMSNFS